MFGGVPELEISRSRKWAAGLDLLTAEKVYFGVGKDTQKAFSLAGRKAIDVPGHNLPDVSSSLPIEVGFGMPRIGSIKIPAANIQCLPLPNLSRAGIVVSSLQRFFRGVAIITKPEPNGGKPSEISPDRTFRSLWGLFLPQIITGNLARKSHQSNSFLYSAYAGKKLYNTVG